MPLPNITLTGNVVDDPELRFTPSGKAKVSFRVAANERRRTEAGGWTDGDSCFLTVQAWEQAADGMARVDHRGGAVQGARSVRSGRVLDGSPCTQTMRPTQANPDRLTAVLARHLDNRQAQHVQERPLGVR